MSNRKPLNLWLTYTSALALVAAIVTAPIRSAGFVVVSSRSDSFRYSLAIPQNYPTRIGGMVITSASLIKAIHTENEEQQPTELSYTVVRSFTPPSSSPREHAQSLTDLGLTRTCYPLRC
jgi:hypothetical protein